MTPEQQERVFVKLLGRVRANAILDERQCLLAARAHFEGLREQRGNRLPVWDWEQRPKARTRRKRANKPAE